MVKLISPLIPAGEDSQLCFSFWYAAFGAGESALMQISKQDGNTSTDSSAEKVNVGDKNQNHFNILKYTGFFFCFKIWSLEARNMDTTRPMWMPAQVTVESSRDFHIVLEGQATNGGFAVDDITFTPGSCPSK